MGGKIRLGRSFLRSRSLAEEYVILYNRSYNTASETAVQRLKPTRAIQPVSEFRANAAKFIEQVRETKEPIVLTQHGRGAAVLVDIDSWHDLVERVHVLDAAVSGLEAERNGGLVAHDDLKQELRALRSR